MTRSNSKTMPSIDHTKRRYSLLLLFVLAVFSGVVQVVSFDNTILFLLLNIATASAATAWIVSDSRIHGHTPVHVVQGIVFCTWPASSFVYLVASRRLWGAGLWILTASGLFIVLTLTFVITLITLHLLGWADIHNLP